MNYLSNCSPYVALQAFGIDKAQHYVALQAFGIDKAQHCSDYVQLPSVFAHPSSLTTLDG
jgi:hypothetical protein